MKAVITLIVCGCLAAITILATNNFSEARAQQETSKATSAKVQDRSEEETELSTFMRKKLDASNQILEGLVTDDLTMVDEGAEKLLKMSDAERWRASNDMMYMHHSREFRRSVEAMQGKARKKSIDGAALEWIDVTMSCIRCHEWVRDTMIADLQLKDGMISLSSKLNSQKATGGGR